MVKYTQQDRNIFLRVKIQNHRLLPFYSFPARQLLIIWPPLGSDDCHFKKLALNQNNVSTINIICYLKQKETKIRNKQKRLCQTSGQVSETVQLDDRGPFRTRSQY